MDRVEPNKGRARAGTHIRKKRILALARKLFWQNGYHSVGMRELARAYGCQPANLYNYFETKEAILFEMLREEMAKIIEPIAHLEEQDGDAVEQLRFIISRHVKAILSHPRSGKALFDVALGILSRRNRNAIVSMRDTYERIVRKVLRRGQEQGVFLPCDEKLVGVMIASMVTRTKMWFHPKKGATVDELADFIFRFVLGGIQADEATHEALWWPPGPMDKKLKPI
ncbi:MAG: TetR/AcrR family transcriptional regulator [Thermodesulfobacteriota bacterium]